jgi:hypothetical protein
MLAELTGEEQTAILAELLSLDQGARAACLRRIRRRLSGSDDEQYAYSGDVVMGIARKADAGGPTLAENYG